MHLFIFVCTILASNYSSSFDNVFISLSVCYRQILLALSQYSENALASLAIYIVYSNSAYSFTRPSLGSSGFLLE